jgi:hypothetical protein
MCNIYCPLFLRTLQLVTLCLFHFRFVLYRNMLRFCSSVILVRVFIVLWPAAVCSAIHLSKYFPPFFCVSGYIATLYGPRSVLGRRHVCLPHLYLATQFPRLQNETCSSIVVVRVTIVHQYNSTTIQQYIQ